ncbi:uncharacterized protein LOC113859696 [Abrus precatorius]|uniref:Uncharacterized protein LOC113859696 n=1 Tax=Abrus precatorius TaxID=3816 RepID=A0A8B8KWF5_ABRPR|nr:uncharacterized protein LOC113859696 [Abrus precatorius]
MANLSVPYAILPRIENTHVVEIDYDDDEDTNTLHRYILGVQENKLYEWKNMFMGHLGAWCVGSSKDFLMLLDSNGSPFLVNPSSTKSIRLPNFPTKFMYVSYSYFVQFLRKTFVSKGVVMRSPSPSQYTLAIMYSYPCKLAFCKNGTWVQLHDAKHTYCDIVFHNNILYALGENCSLEAWEFGDQENPRKIFDAELKVEIDAAENVKFPENLFSTRYYLVISEGEFLLVERFIGNNVNADGVAVCEGDFDDGEIRPYRTLHFGVYKLDFRKLRWGKKKSLHDQVLFLGTNESTSVPAKAISGCEANSIYFTDDRLEEMGLDYSYGGHDWGVFILHDGSVKLLTPFTDKLDPPPIWVVPTSEGLSNLPLSS